jgi:hypothetical protein
MSTNTSQRQSRKRSRTNLTAAKERMDKRGIAIERAVIRQDVMMEPFSFIHQIFRNNEWMSLFTSSKIYPKIVREFYLHLEIVDILQQCPVLKTTIRGVEIRIDPDLISLVTDIPLVHPLGIPFPDLDNAPSWEELLAFFDPTGTQVWGPNQTYLPIGWLQSPQ